MKIAIIFGRILQEARLDKGFSQEKLADLSGLDRSYISMLERGLRQPTINSLFSISKILEVKPSAIIKMVEERYEIKN